MSEFSTWDGVPMGSSSGKLSIINRQPIVNCIWNSLPVSLGDVNDSYTKLYMKPTDITDDSITATFPEKALYFDRNVSYLTVPNSVDFELGSSDFTIDFWINIIVGGKILAKRINNSSMGFIITQATATSVELYATSNNSTWDIFNLTTICTGLTLNTWNHIAITRQGATWRGFVNGNLTNTLTNSATLATNSGNLYILGEDGSSLNGFLSDFRLSKGIARWISSFTPPTSYTIDSYTKLLIHGDSLHDSTGRTITVSGNVNVQNAATIHPITQYGNTRIDNVTPRNYMYFDGNGDYLTVPDSPDFDFGSNDFTIDFWVYLNDTSGVHTIISKDTASTRSFVVQSNGTSLYFAISAVWGTQSLLVGARQWTHIYFGRQGNTWYRGINGIVSSETYTGAVTSSSAPVEIGRQGTYANYYNGSITALRVSKGIARWTSNFTPPTSTYGVDSYTKLLLQSTNGVITDNCGKAITVNGETKVIMNPPLEKAIYFDGAGDYLSVADSTDWDFPSDFTLDFWVNFTSYPSYTAVLSTSNNGNYNDGFVLEFSSVRGISFFNYGISVLEDTIISYSSIQPNTWYHVAVVRNGAGTNNLKLYVNGMLSGQNTFTSTINGGSNSLLIGKLHGTCLANEYFPGQLANIRVSKNVARWTSNFTPPFNVSTDVSTKLLLTDSVVDTSGMSKAITKYGDTKIVNNYAVDRAVYFDGSGDYLTIPDSADWNFGSENFTIDFWVKLNSIGTYVSGGHTYSHVFTKSTSDSYSPLIIGLRDGVWCLWGCSNGISSGWNIAVETPFWTAPIRTWHHMAVVRNGTDISVYKDGIKASNSITTSLSLWANNQPIYIGAINYSLPCNMDGLLSKFRISKGIARWTADFTPPTDI